MSNDRPFEPYEAVRAERLKKGDLRNIQEASCIKCKHVWFAPVVGRCPRCHAEGATIGTCLEIGVSRV